MRATPAPAPPACCGCGDSMGLELSEDARLLVDTGRRVPATGEMLVRRHGNGLLVKRIKPVPGDRGAPGLRLKLANPDTAASPGRRTWS